MSRIGTQKISNHKVFTDIERTVLIDSFQPVESRQEINIRYLIKYEKEGVDVSHQFKQPDNIIFANNEKLLFVRDENFQPIPNPDFVPQYSEADLLSLIPLNIEDKFLEPVEGEPVLNPEWVPEYAPEELATLTPLNLDDAFLRLPAYDYVISFLDLPIKITDVIKLYILDNDADGFFDL